MARKRRLIREGFCYHVMLRGNSGQNIFKDDADRYRFCLLLQYASEKHNLVIHGFCFMRNHVHLVIQPVTTNLSDGMHALGFRYAQYFNKKYEQRGYLYQGRYKAVVVQSGVYLRRLIRYIHLNPVRAKITQKPEDYRWSSHSAYIEKAEYFWLNRTLILNAFGGDKEGVERLSTYVQMNEEEARHEVIEIRNSLQKGAYGDDEFLKEWRPELSKSTRIVGSQPGNIEKITIQCIIEAVCSYCKITREEVSSDKRSPKHIQARALMAILTKRLKICSMANLSEQISRDSTSLAKLARKGNLDPQLQHIAEELLEKFGVEV